MVQYQDKEFKKACGLYFLSKKEGGLDKKELIDLALELAKVGRIRNHTDAKIKNMGVRELCDVIRPVIKDLPEGVIRPRRSGSATSATSATPSTPSAVEEEA